MDKEVLSLEVLIMSVINTRSNPASSPCVGLCTTTTGDAVCKGCGRSLEEIREWNTYTDEKKVQIKERIREEKGHELGNNKC